MANYTWSVANASAYKGDMVVKQYSSFNLGAGDTLTPDARAQGVMLFVDGDATIDGTIQVKGAYLGTPADLSWNMAWIKSGETGTFTNSSTEWGNGSSASNGVQSTLDTILTKMPTTSSNSLTVFTGQNGIGNATGGVGYGGAAPNNGQDNKNQGSPFAGGAGGNGDITSSDTEVRYGGRGGNGQGGAYAMGNGAGNPGGSGANNAAGDYSGGLFVLCASGDILGSGTINCSGSNGGYAAFTSTEVLYAYGGGGAGGGRIILIAGGSISGSITCNVNGGSGGGATGSKYLSLSGSSGNNGTVTKVESVGV
jgi:hypothetical protein